VRSGGKPSSGCPSPSKIRPQHLRSDRHRRHVPFHHDTAARADALHFTQRHQQHTILAESDHFCHDGAMAALTGDLADLSDRGERPRGFNDDPDGLGHPARDG
jgi:hypothetical protein